ncbi:hypothetical protein TWF481_003538 [Arthrobotrys musiformis]|uniref:F-box domain-containing protein n=1 Tax=Arthrobotrys musiformis TaxID=47236 RepID=A0AAV9WMI6_9PEZI
MPLLDLPKEIHHEILSHLDEIVDQIACAAAFPLWDSLLQTKALRSTRYSSDEYYRPGFPRIHRIIHDLASQVSCVVKSGTVECYRLRFQKGSWWDNPNLQDTWDISTCCFLDESLIKPAAEPDGGQSWKLDISTISPLSWSYPQTFEFTEATTVREFIDSSTGANINLEGYLEGEGLPLNTYQEIIVSNCRVFGGGRYGEQERHPQDADVIMTATVSLVRRSTKQYQEWMMTDRHLEATRKFT